MRADLNLNYLEDYKKILKDLDILDYSPIKGCYFVLPYGLKLLETIHNKVIYQTEHQKIKIPSFLSKADFLLEPIGENKFSKEIFFTSKKDYILKPTSEMILYPYLKKKISSWKFLPIKVYAQNSVFRKENSVNMGVRSQEIFGFLEHHGLYSSHEQSKRDIGKFQKIYSKMLTDLNIPFKIITRTKEDTFPGANHTIAFDTIIKNVRLQLATIHDLETNFSVPLDIKYKTKDNSYSYAYINCAGISERILFCLIYFNYDFKNNILKLPESILKEKIIIHKKFLKEKDLKLLENNDKIIRVSDLNYAINKNTIKHLVQKGYNFTLRLKNEKYLLINNYIKKEKLFENLEEVLTEINKFDYKKNNIIKNSLEIKECELDFLFSNTIQHPFKVKYDSAELNIIELLETEMKKKKINIYGFDENYIYGGFTL